MSHSLEYGESKKFFVGQKVPLKIRPQAPGILIQSEEGVTQNHIIKNFKVGNQNHGVGF